MMAFNTLKGLSKPGDKMDVGLTNVIQSMTAFLNSPDEKPYKVERGKFVENPADDELKKQVKSIKTDMKKLMKAMMNRCDVMSFRDQREKIHHKVVKIMPKVDSRNEETFRVAKKRYRRNDKHLHMACQDNLEREIEHGSNVGLRNMPFDVTEASHEQLDQLFSLFPSFKYVHDRDASGFCKYLARNCPLFGEKTALPDNKMCDCLKLTLINKIHDKPRSPLHFAVANNNYKMSCPLTSFYSPASVPSRLERSHKGQRASILHHLLLDSPVKLEEERSKLITLLSDSKFCYNKYSGEKNIGPWYLPRDFTVKTDYLKNVYQENFFSLCLTNNHWEVCKQAFKLCQNLNVKQVAQILNDLVRTGQVRNGEEFMRELAVWLVIFSKFFDINDPHDVLFPHHFDRSKPLSTETFLHAAFKTNNPDMVNLTFQFVKAFLDERQLNYKHIRDHDSLTIPEMASYHGHREMTVFFEHLNIGYEPLIEEYYGLMEGSVKCEELVNAIISGQCRTYDNLPLVSTLVALDKDELAYKILRYYFTQPTAETAVIADINDALICALYPGFNRLYSRSPDGSIVYDYTRMINIVAMLLAAGAELPYQNSKKYSYIGRRVPAKVKQLVQDVQKLNEKGIHLQKVFPLETALRQLTDIVDHYLNKKVKQNGIGMGVGVSKKERVRYDPTITPTALSPSGQFSSFASRRPSLSPIDLSRPFETRNNWKQIDREEVAATRDKKKVHKEHVLAERANPIPGPNAVFRPKKIDSKSLLTHQKIYEKFLLISLKAPVSPLNIRQMHRFEEDDNEDYLCPSTRYLAVLILILCFIPFTAVFIVSAGETFNYRIVAIALSVYSLVARAFFCLINSSCCSNCCLDELEEDAELLVEVVID